MAKKVLITRYGAFGDHIHATHLPRLLKEKLGFDFVGFEYNTKGLPIYCNNPYIDQHIHFEPARPPICDYPESFLNKRHEILCEEYGYTRHINLQKSLEYGYIGMEDTNDYYLGSEARRKKYGKYNYYDQTSVWAGHPEFIGEVGALYFDQEEKRVVRSIYKKSYKDKFVIIVNLSGTSKHKLFLNAEKIIKKFLSTHKHAVCITMGDKACKEHVEFSGRRIVNRAGVYPIRQSMLMTKYADLVIGCESGLMVASTLLGAPTLQLMTAASIVNHGGWAKKDHSLQAPVSCSPCHKGPYEYIGCPTFDFMNQRYPECIKFDIEAVLEVMEHVYANRK